MHRSSRGCVPRDVRPCSDRSVSGSYSRMNAHFRLAALGCLLGIALFGGCRSTDLNSPYQSIVKGMTKEEVIAKIGRPDTVKGPVALWRTGTSQDRDSYALILTFDANDVVIDRRSVQRHAGNSRNNDSLVPSPEREFQDFVNSAPPTGRDPNDR